VERGEGRVGMVGGEKGRIGGGKGEGKGGERGDGRAYYLGELKALASALSPRFRGIQQ